MREILFRGRTNYGLWVYGFYNHIPCGRYQSDEHCIQTINEDGRIGMLFNVDAETVGQFTGLTDKNGKKIFEGDIVVYDNTPYNAYGHRVIGVMVWHKWMWKFRYKEYESTYHYSCGSEDFFGAKSEVIGNIHDNPELLEE